MSRNNIRPGPFPKKKKRRTLGPFPSDQPPPRSPSTLNPTTSSSSTMAFGQGHPPPPTAPRAERDPPRGDSSHFKSSSDRAHRQESRRQRSRSRSYSPDRWSYRGREENNYRPVYDDPRPGPPRRNLSDRSSPHRANSPSGRSPLGHTRTSMQSAPKPHASPIVPRSVPAKPLNAGPVPPIQASTTKPSESVKSPPSTKSVTTSCTNVALQKTTEPKATAARDPSSAVFPQPNSAASATSSASKSMDSALGQYFGETTALLALKIEVENCKRKRDKRRAEYEKGKESHPKYPVIKENHIAALRQADEALRTARAKVAEEERRHRSLSSQVAEQVLPEILRQTTVTLDSQVKSDSRLEKAEEDLKKLKEEKALDDAATLKFQDEYKKQQQEHKDQLEKFEKMFQEFTQTSQAKYSTLEVKIEGNDNKAEVAKLQEQITNHGKDFLQIKTIEKNIEAKVVSSKLGLQEALKSGVGALETRISRLEAVSTESQPDIQTATRLDELESTLVKTNQEVVKANKGVVELVKSVGLLTEDYAKVENLPDRATATDSSVNRLVERMTAVEGSTAGLATETKKIKKNASILDGRVRGFEESYSDAQKPASKLESTSSSPAPGVAPGINPSIAKIEEVISRMEKAIPALEARVSHGEIGQKNLGEKVKSIEEEMPKLLTKVEARAKALVDEEINDFSKEFDELLDNDINSRFKTLDDKLTSAIAEVTARLNQHVSPAAPDNSNHAALQEEFDTFKSNFMQQFERFKQFVVDDTARQFRNIPELVRPSLADLKDDIEKTLAAYLKDKLESLTLTCESNEIQTQNLSSRMDQIDSPQLAQSILNQMFSAYPQLVNLTNAAEVINGIHTKMKEIETNLEKVSQQATPRPSAEPGQGWRQEMDRVTQNVTKTSSTLKRSEERFKIQENLTTELQEHMTRLNTKLDTGLAQVNSQIGRCETDGVNFRNEINSRFTGVETSYTGLTSRVVQLETDTTSLTERANNLHNDNLKTKKDCADIIMESEAKVLQEAKADWKSQMTSISEILIEKDKNLSEVEADLGSQITAIGTRVGTVESHPMLAGSWPSSAQIASLDTRVKILEEHSVSAQTQMNSAQRAVPSSQLGVNQTAKNSSRSVLSSTTSSGMSSSATPFPTGRQFLARSPSMVGGMQSRKKESKEDRKRKHNQASTPTNSQENKASKRPKRVHPPPDGDANSDPDFHAMEPEIDDSEEEDIKPIKGTKKSRQQENVPPARPKGLGQVINLEDSD